METHEENPLIKGIPRKFLDELIEAAAYIAVSDPITYSEAINSQNSQEWQKAMETDVLNLENQDTWTLVEPSKDRKILKGKWIYKTKLNSEGKIERYKARWVVKGFLQLFGLDYTETFANTVKPNAFRALFAIAAILDWEIDQWNIKSAFPNAPIDEEIYMEQPTGFETKKGLVCKLNKALSGLK